MSRASIFVFGVVGLPSDGLSAVFCGGAPIAWREVSRAAPYAAPPRRAGPGLLLLLFADGSFELMVGSLPPRRTASSPRMRVVHAFYRVIPSRCILELAGRHSSLMQGALAAQASADHLINARAYAEHRRAAAYRS